jgi:hypothetical protein
MNRRLSLALPSKGRLREPSWSLLEASGVSPQEPGERVLQSHCRNADIDLLFVRAEDVPEYVQDGVVDCGITGLDLISERECDVEVLLRLGYGACSLQAAVSMEDAARSIEDLSGRRIATSHPRIALAPWPSARCRGRTRAGHRIGGDLTAAGSRRRDHRPRVDRQHAAHQRPSLHRYAVRIRGGVGRKDRIDRSRSATDAHDGARFGHQRSGQSLPLVQRRQGSPGRSDGPAADVGFADDHGPSDARCCRGARVGAGGRDLVTAAKTEGLRGRARS